MRKNQKMPKKPRTEAQIRANKHLMPPWPKGTSGNPKGIAPGRSIEDYAHHILNAKDSDGVPRKKKIAHMIIARAEKGDEKILKLLLDRIWPATQQLAVQAEMTVDIPKARQSLAERLERIEAVAVEPLTLPKKALEPDPRVPVAATEAQTRDDLYPDASAVS